MDALKTCQFSRTHSIQISAYSKAWTELIVLSEFLKKKVCFQGSNLGVCVCVGGGASVGKDRVVVMVVCFSSSVGELMMFVWRYWVWGGCIGVCVGVGVCVCVIWMWGGVGGWMSG